MTSPAAICELVEVAYWASLQTEETRPVRGTLRLVDPERVNTPICLLDPIRLSLTSVIEMLAASGGRDVGVHLSDGEAVTIWGFVDVRSALEASVRIVSPGTVVICSGGDTIGLLANGEAVSSVSKGMTDLHVLTARALGTDSPFGERLRKGAMSTAIVRAMLKHGHGGMLVLVPPNRQCWESLALVKYPIDLANGAHVLNDRLTAFQDCSNRAEAQEQASLTADNPSAAAGLAVLLARSRDAHEQLLRDGLDWVGQLTAVDGAVLMTTEMDVLGFGAKLRASDAEPIVSVLDMLVPEVPQAHVSVSALGGMRHQSAARFVNDCHDALVFVASQDGRLTLLAWIESPPHVAALTNLQHVTWTS
jgi:hypothetical protein